jgi:hypothetical protein
MSCPSTTATFTDSQLTELFPNGYLQLLPNNPSRTSNGVLLNTSVTSWITALLQNNKLPTQPSTVEFNNAAKSASNTNSQNTVIQNYITAENTFATNLKNEYCHYEARYKAALKTLLTKLSTQYSTAGNVNASITADVDRYLTVTESLNIKLNDLIMLSNGVAQNRLTLAQANATTANEINQELQTHATNLQKQAAILKDKSSTTDLYKRMVEYTEEKNRANRNLLSLYSFLNIVALGMLVYVYRASN